MSEFDNPSLSPIISQELPDWSNNGYQLLERLGTHEEEGRSTYLAQAGEKLVVIKEWRDVEYAGSVPTIERLKLGILGIMPSVGSLSPISLRILPCGCPDPARALV